MKLGIVGLPNVGKSTLFNSLTKAGALSANYPFATIDPNVGIVSVPDERIVKLGELYHTKKVTPATIEFVDIAGLVKGASKGEGLGNQFLANIREVDAIVHVVRCFEDTNIIHVDGSIDPARDIETINLELIFSDIEILDRRIAKIAKQARMDKTLAKELELVEAVKAHLEDGKMARTFEVPDDDDAQIWFKGYNLLTAKPTIYAANVAEDDLADDGASNPHVAKVREMAKEEGAEVFVICAQIEQEAFRTFLSQRRPVLLNIGRQYLISLFDCFRQPVWYGILLQCQYRGGNFRQRAIFIGLTGMPSGTAATDFKIRISLFRHNDRTKSFRNSHICADLHSSALVHNAAKAEAALLHHSAGNRRRGGFRGTHDLLIIPIKKVDIEMRMKSIPKQGFQTSQLRNNMPFTVDGTASPDISAGRRSAEGRIGPLT